MASSTTKTPLLCCILACCGCPGPAHGHTRSSLGHCLAILCSFDTRIFAFGKSCPRKCRVDAGNITHSRSRQLLVRPSQALSRPVDLCNTRVLLDAIAFGCYRQENLNLLSPTLPPITSSFYLLREHPPRNCSRYARENPGLRQRTYAGHLKILR